MRKPFLLILLILPGLVWAQYKVEIRVRALPEYHQKGSEVFIAGSFNNWNPGDKDFKLEYDDGAYKIKLKLLKGSYEYKFTRGSWDKGETSAGGKGISNRQLIVTTDTEAEVDIQGWQDHFPPVPKLSTAGRQVKILDTAFYIPQLNRYRRVWIYLPSDYSSRKKRYPVLYLHDGQNVFDDSTSYSGEWGVDEFFDTTRMQKAIVVAIDHGGQYRLNEYSPYDMERFGKGEGTSYVDFLVKNLKPYIDMKYRTLRDRGNTFIAGSSMGGLISMYAVLRYPNVFGGAGVFSPAFWVAPRIFDYIGLNGKKMKSKIFFYAGKLESEEMVPDMLKAFDQLSHLTKAKMTTLIRDEGRHHEAAWRKEFPLFYEWILMK